MRREFEGLGCRDLQADETTQTLNPKPLNPKPIPKTTLFPAIGPLTGLGLRAANSQGGRSLGYAAFAPIVRRLLGNILFSG